MADIDVVRYVPGARIDQNKTLEIVGIRPDRWGPIEVAYPEIRAAGPDAALRKAANVTIFPPRYMSERSLRGARNVYAQNVVAVCTRGDGGPLSAVLLRAKGAKYESLHVYRAYAPRRGVWRWRGRQR